MKNFRNSGRTRLAVQRARSVRLVVESLEARDTPTTSAVEPAQPLPIAGEVSSPSSVDRFGDPLIFTATFRGVDPGSTTPDGSATFFIDGRRAGTVDLTRGAASITTTLTIGEHDVFALFAPAETSAYAAYNTSSLMETILPLPARGSIVSSSPVTRFGDPVTFIATFRGIEPDASVPEGSVDFFVNGHLAGKVDLVDGVASLTTSTLTAKAYDVFAMYTPAPDSVYRVSWTPWIRQVIQPLQLNGFVRSSTPISHLGQPTTFTATFHGVPVGPGVAQGSARLFVDGQFIASAKLGNGAARLITGLLTSGIHRVFAVYAPLLDLGFSAFTTPVILQLIA
jgi:hypothetical protein